MPEFKKCKDEYDKISSQSVKLEKELSKFKNVSFSKDIKSAIFKSDLIIIHTEWNDFKSINFKNLVKKKNFTIFDLRNIYSSLKMRQLKIKYFAIGK